MQRGDTLALDIHVANDLRHSLSGAVVDAHLRWPGGEQRWRFGGDIPADDVVRVGAISWVADVAERGALHLSLSLTGPTEATNAYSASLLA